MRGPSPGSTPAVVFGVVALLGVLLAGLVPETTGAAPRSGSYTGGLVGPVAVNTGCGITLAGPANVGGICRGVDSGSTAVTVDLDDLVSPHVSARVHLLSASGAILNDDRICDRGTVEVPSSATTVAVYVEDPLFGTAHCVLEGEGPTFPTRGTISLAFT